MWGWRGCWVKTLSVLKVIFACCYVGKVTLTGHNSTKQTEWNCVFQKLVLTTEQKFLEIYCIVTFMKNFDF